MTGLVECKYHREMITECEIACSYVVVKTMRSLVLLLHLNVAMYGPRWVNLPSEMKEAKPPPMAFVSVYPKKICGVQGSFLSCMLFFFVAGAEKCLVDRCRVCVGGGRWFQ